MNTVTRALLTKYTPPSWVDTSGLPEGFVPKYKIKLGGYPTPIEKWNLDRLKKIKEYSNIDQASNYFIKRDDLADFVLSGNKARKLEFLLADAIDKGSDCVITVGGIQSNHCRATAMAARRLGLEPYLLLRNDTHEITDKLEGNLMLDRLCGSQIHIFTPNQVKKLGGNDKMLMKFANELRAKGKNPYIIPLGGSNPLGTWGYIEAANEIISQIKASELKIDDVVVACGTGGTAAGLVLGLNNLNIKVHPVCVSNDARYFHQHINAIFTAFKFSKTSEECCDIIEGYKGIGYNKSTGEEIRLLRDIALETGVVLDPAYTLKAVRGMLYESGRLFQNRNVLFVHTGGVFGLWTNDKMSMLSTALDETSTVQPLNLGNTNNSDNNNSEIYYMKESGNRNK
jgi:D-cysteine desulfhydrase family pyridoxal phosphate-dependent enzyme